MSTPLLITVTCARINPCNKQLFVSERNPRRKLKKLPFGPFHKIYFGFASVTCHVCRPVFTRTASPICWFTCRRREKIADCLCISVPLHCIILFYLDVVLKVRAKLVQIQSLYRTYNPVPSPISQLFILKIVQHINCQHHQNSLYYCSILSILCVCCIYLIFHPPAPFLH